MSTSIVLSAAADDVVDTATPHGFVTNDAIRFSDLTGGTGITANQTYYVIATGLAAQAFKFSALVGGSAVDFTTDIEAGTVERVSDVTVTDFLAGLARDLRDPDGKTFEPDVMVDLLNQAISEISRIAPRQLLETITPVEDQYEYETDITEGMRVEVWTLDPNRIYLLVAPAQAEYVNTTEAGWEVWDGKLRLPYGIAASLDPAEHVIKFWGYGPHPQFTSLDQVSTMDPQTSWAVREYATYRGYDRLTTDRALYTQWQTQAGNSDTSLAAINAIVGNWEQRWNRRRKQLFELRR